MQRAPIYHGIDYLVWISRYADYWISIAGTEHALVHPPSCAHLSCKWLSHLQFAISRLHEGFFTQKNLRTSKKIQKNRTNPIWEWTTPRDYICRYQTRPSTSTRLAVLIRLLASWIAPRRIQISSPLTRSCPRRQDLLIFSTKTNTQFLCHTRGKHNEAASRDALIH